jgi:hypothetical protein
MRILPFSLRRSSAAIVSVCLHVAVILSFWIVRFDAAGAANADLRPDYAVWNLVDARAGGAPGYDPLRAVLSAPDVVRVVLAPVGGRSDGQGLAWWSPSTGLWFAVDGLGVPPSRTRYRLRLTFGSGGRTTPGFIQIDSDGSGRMIAVPRSPISVPPQDEVVFELVEQRGGWFSRSTEVLLSGSLVRRDRARAP